MQWLANAVAPAEPWLAVHTCCWANTWYIELAAEVAEKTLNCDMRPHEEGGDVVTVPVPKGSVTVDASYPLLDCCVRSILLFNNLIPHQSLENHSEGVRWSFDLRWQVRGCWTERCQ